MVAPVLPVTKPIVYSRLNEKKQRQVLKKLDSKKKQKEGGEKVNRKSYIPFLEEKEEESPASKDVKQAEEEDKENIEKNKNKRKSPQQEEKSSKVQKRARRVKLKEDHTKANKECEDLEIRQDESVAWEGKLTASTSPLPPSTSL